MNDAHMVDAPVTRSTYLKGCRCDGCREANATYTRRRREDRTTRTNLHMRAGSLTNRLAIRWIKQHHPDVWRQLLEQAKKEVGL